MPIYIWGKTLDSYKIEEYTSSNCDFSINELTVYIAKSYPTGNTNLIFPKGIALCEYLLHYKVKRNSSYAYFIKPKKKPPKIDTSVNRDFT